MATAKDSDLAASLGLRSDPEPLRFLAEAGFLWLDLLRLEPAESIFAAVVALAPDDPTGHVGNAEVKRRRGDLTGALGSLDKAARAPHADAKNLAMVFRKRGEVNLLQKKRELAEKAFLKAAALDPDGPEAEVAMAYVEAMRAPTPRDGRKTT